MVLIDIQLTASEVLRAFHHDEPYLFLGAAFSTVAWIAAGFCILRRRWDALLVWMAIFAHLYGQRLWLDSFLLRMSIPDTLFLAKLRLATDFLIPIPGFIFFQVAGFIPKEESRSRRCCARCSAFLWWPPLWRDRCPCSTRSTMCL